MIARNRLSPSVTSSILALTEKGTEDNEEDKQKDESEMTEEEKKAAEKKKLEEELRIKNGAPKLPLSDE